MDIQPIIAKLAPRAHHVYRQAFARAEGLPTTPLRLAHFLAQCCHETTALTVLQENLNYTSAERLCAVWPSRFRTVAAARPFVRNPAGLAEEVYGQRMGNLSPGDGWRYIGRGLLQLTGREAYAEIGERIGVNLVARPELAALETHALPVALAVWKWKGCDAHADADSVRLVTRAINGGQIGLRDREEWLERTKQAVMEMSV